MPSPLTTIPSTGLEANLVNTITQGVGPKITSITYVGDDTAALPAGGQTITVNGSGFKNTSTIYIDGAVVGVVSYVDANTLTFVAPAKAASNYSLYVVNADGATAISVPGISYSNAPVWSTSSGSIGSPYEANSFNVSLSATGDGSVTYAMAAGNSLPSGLTLASNGYISGTVPATDPTTTYTFYVVATDSQNQDTERSFSITYNKDAVTWSSPANGAAYSLTAGTANTVSLSATSAAGKSITYSVQSGTLPANVSISGSNLTGTPNTGQNNTSVVIRATAADTNRFADQTLYFTVTAITNFIKKFTKTYAQVYDIGVDSSGNVYACGFNTGSTSFIAKFDSTGTCLFIKTITSGSSHGLSRIHVTSNGTFYTSGYVSSGSQYGYVVKWNSSGEKIWESGVTRPNVIRAVFEDSDGSVWAVGGGQGDTGEDHHLIKFDSSGSRVGSWNSTDSRSNGLNGIYVDADFVYLCGYQEYTNYGNEYNGYVAKLSKSNPTSVSWSKSISRDLGILTDETVRSITVDASGNIYGVMTGMKQGQAYYELSVFKLSSNGSSFDWIRKFTDSQGSGSYGGVTASITLTSNNLFVSMVHASKQSLVARYNTAGSLQWKRQFKLVSNGTLGTTSIPVSGDYFYVGFADSTDSVDSFITKFNIDGTGQNTYSNSVIYANNDLTEEARTEYSLYNNGVGFSSFTPSAYSGTLTLSANNPSGVFTFTNILG